MAFAVMIVEYVPGDEKPREQFPLEAEPISAFVVVLDV
jgi:hypothetical protein